MNLSAIIIEDHEFLFSKPEILTFGTAYNYTLKFDNDLIHLSIDSNEDFVDNLFNVKGNKIQNLSAVVGKNGIGKTTILNLIRGIINDREFEFPSNNSLIIVENEGIPQIYYDNLNRPILIKIDGKLTDLENVAKYISTIYYSPVFNFTHNQNRDNDDSFDISFDNLLYQDLTNSRNLDDNKSGWSYSPNEELIFKNVLRQIDFLHAPFLKENVSLKKLFGIQYPNTFKIFIRGYKKGEEEEWNTPYSFRPIIKLIDSTLEKEIRDWYLIRKFDKNDRVLNQLEINKYLLKRYSIRAFLSVLFKKMEQKNLFLQEGEIDFNKIDAANQTALELFIYFVKNAKINYHGSIKNVFTSDVVEELFSRLYNVIDKVELEDQIQNDFVYSQYEDITEILRLQDLFLKDLASYFYLFYKTDDQKLEMSDRVEGFLHFYPFDKTLSSGQHSFLNLFSRIDSCIKNLKTERLSGNMHFVLLLDEGDLTFHPNWKRKYINILIEIIPQIFKEFSKICSLEIILTTHDPLTLSDIPRTKINYLVYDENSTSIKNSENQHTPNKTFGANISEILAHSYFLEDGLIGDFAYDKIRETIDWLNDEDNLDNSLYHKNIIKLIDEPIVQLKLSEMFDEKTNSDFQINIIEDQIKKLQSLKSQITGK